MNINTIQKKFIDSVLLNFDISPYGKDRFYISTSFYLDDGDEMVVVLKNDSNRWVFSDEGHTFMYLSYRMDSDSIYEGKRGEVISRVLTMFDIEERDGELILDVSHGRYGEALHCFIQAIQKISNVIYWIPYKVYSTFKDDIGAKLYQTIDESRVRPNWYHPTLDSNKTFKVDYCINGLDCPVFIYALNTPTSIYQAGMSLGWFKDRGVEFFPFGILEDAKSVKSKPFRQMEYICKNYEVGIDAGTSAIYEYVKDNS